MKLTDTLYSRVRGNPPSLATFAKQLRQELHGAEVEPFEGLTLQSSLEALMKVAKHELVRIPELLSGGSTAADRVTNVATLCDETLSLTVWLRTQGCPTWLIARADVPGAFAAARDVALGVGDLRLALHYTAALFALPATVLGTSDALTRGDLERLRVLDAKLGAGALVAELEVWNDVFSSYRLYR